MIILLQYGDSTAVIWDISTERILSMLRGHENNINTAKFSLDDKIITAYDDKIAQIWNIPDPQELIDKALDIEWIQIAARRQKTVLFGVIT